MSRITDQMAHEAITAYAEYGSYKEAGEALGVGESTVRRRVAVANERDISPEITDIQAYSEDRLRNEIAVLTREVARLTKTSLSTEKVADQIYRISDLAAAPPDWITEPGGDLTYGVPVTMWSDWHWGETVKPEPINHINEFNIEIGHERVRRLVEKIKRLCFEYKKNPSYPGIVVCLGGDLITGDIHEELTVTNSLPVLPAIQDLFDVLVWAITEMADAFGRVHVPCVAGNHGRNTVRPRFKESNETNFDWHIACLLARHFKNDPRVTFQIPEGPDLHFMVLGHKYMLTHGDKLGVRGGDGIIGSIGPIVRGDWKTRRQSEKMSLPYDTLIIGHFHQYIPLAPRLMCNGSLIGANEYSIYALRSDPEPPIQSLWFTHEDGGIIDTMPIWVDRTSRRKDAEWLKVPIF